MDHKELAKKEEALKLKQEQHNLAAAARRAELASLCASPGFQRLMLGPEGYLSGLIQDAEKVLLNENATPLNDAAKMAVHLATWRYVQALHKDFTAFAETPAPTSV
jgi:hypothetical protein